MAHTMKPRFLRHENILDTAFVHAINCIHNEHIRLDAGILCPDLNQSGAEMGINMTGLAYVFGPLLFYILLNFWTVYIGKKTFGVSLPVTLMISVLLVYISQFVFGTFSIGLCICLIFSAAAIIALIMHKSLLKKDPLVMKRFFSSGFYAFLVIYFLFLIVDYRRFFTSWDELSHWGKMVKEMLRLDSFYCDPASDLLVHKDYPPFASLFQMLWCRLTLEYSEAGVTTALHVFEFAILIPPVTDRLQDGKALAVKRALLYDLLLTVIFAMLIFNFDFSGFNTIYMDLLMPILYAYIISVIMDRSLRRSGFGYCSILIGQTCLIISKQMSISFVLLAWLFFTVCEITDSGARESFSGKALVKKYSADKRFSGNGRTLLLLCRSSGVLFIPALANMSWSHYVKTLGISGQFDLSTLNLGAFLDIIKGGGTFAQHNVYKDYINALFTMTQSSGTFKLPYAAAVLLAVCILFCLYYLFRKVMDKKELAGYLTVFLTGSVCYALTMLVLYMFFFSESEMIRLASYQRYMCSYVVSEYLLLLLILIDLLNRAKIDFMHFKYLITSLGVCLLMFDASKLSNLSPQLFNGMPLSDYHSRAEKLRELSADGDRIFLVSTSNGATMYFLNYYLDDREFDARYLYSDVAVQSAENAEYWNTVIDCVKENDYLYVYDSADPANAVLGQFTEGGTLYDDAVYEISVGEDQELLLKYVG